MTKEQLLKNLKKLLNDIKNAEPDVQYGTIEGILWVYNADIKGTVEREGSIWLLEHVIELVEQMNNEDGWSCK